MDEPSSITSSRVEQLRHIHQSFQALQKVSRGLPLTDKEIHLVIHKAVLTWQKMFTKQHEKNDFSALGNVTFSSQDGLPKINLVEADFSRIFQLACRFLRQEEFLSATMLVQVAHKIEQFIEKLIKDGIKHPVVAQTMNDLGNACGDLGDYAEAKRLLEKALAIKKQIHGEKHPSVAATLMNSIKSPNTVSEVIYYTAI